MRTKSGIDFLPARRVGAALFVAALLAGCGSLHAPLPGLTLAQTSTKGQPEILSRAVDDFYARYEASRVAPAATSAESARKMLDAGRVLLELRCEEYLDAIGQSDQASGHLRQQTNLVGGLTSALMGVSGNSAKEIAGVASAFSFAGSSMEAYSTAYLFADAGTSIGKLVRSTQELFWTEVETSLESAVLGHTKAVHILLGYQAICRPAKIRALINDAISTAPIAAEPPPDQRVDQEVMSVLNQLSRALGTPVSEGEAIMLYGRYRKSAADEVTLLEGTKVNVAKLTSLTGIFLPLTLPTSRVGRRWKQALFMAQSPETSLEVQASAATTRNDINQANIENGAAKKAGAGTTAMQVTRAIQKSQEALEEVLKGGDLEKAARSAAAAQSEAAKAKTSAEAISKKFPNAAQPATSAADAAQQTADSSKTLVEKAISSRDNPKEPSRVSRPFSLPNIGVAR